jgi:HEAT repeat protein
MTRLLSLRTPTGFPWLPLLIGLAISLGPLCGGRAPGQEAGLDDDQTATIRGDWTLVLTRDDRVSFTTQSAARALEALERGDLTARERAVILLTLGAGGAVDERPRLQSWAMEGLLEERCAAILALGELGPSASGILLPIAMDTWSAGRTDESRRIAECALLALLRTGRVEVRNAVASVAEGDDAIMAETAAELLVFSVNPVGSTDQRAVRRLLELRWDAARRFGLVDGQSWSSRVLEGLAGDESFLDAIVLEGAASLSRAGIRDHILQSLLEGSGPARLRAAVRAMPLELGRMVELGLWAPADDGEWATLVEEIGQRGLDPLVTPILERATLVERVAPAAASLLARSGHDMALLLLIAGLDSPSAATRQEACLGLARAGAVDDVARLRPLMEDPNAGVRCAAIVGGVRLGDREAPLFLRALLFEGTQRDRERCLILLTQPGAGMLVVPLLEEYAEGAEAVERGLVAAALLSSGRSAARHTLREILRRGIPAGRAGTTMLRALARNAGHDDLEIMARHFPLEGRWEENRIMALALLKDGSPTVLPILRAALWTTPLSRSVLAGALLSHVAGHRALLEEAQSPPIHSGAVDARRVGFAVGTWGGVEEVRRLERLLRRGSGDPTLQGAFLGALASRTH